MQRSSMAAHGFYFWIFLDGIVEYMTCCVALDSQGCSDSVTPLGSALVLLATLICDYDSAKDSSPTVASKILPVFLKF